MLDKETAVAAATVAGYLVGSTQVGDSIIRNVMPTRDAQGDYTNEIVVETVHGLFIVKVERLPEAHQSLEHS